ncbi:hypothetical protein D4764_08G0001720 [Takifugu flavidus]|uniref:Uncharacterized protein n=1 Tax=Takifugu flavidus TaxID=433684 RepID=A0A5C6MN98_9TELE|nr:hypothetical protein D4764_08G0001720 [Takifugu flavidus]
MPCSSISSQCHFPTAAAFLSPLTKELNMQKQVTFFPGKLQVVFRKGPLGFLLQEPSDEAKWVSSTPQDKSAAMREDLVRQNALAVIRQRGGGSLR